MLRPAFIVLCATLFCAANAASQNWIAYGHNGSGNRYAPLDQIKRSNVHKLERAWTTRTGDLPNDPDDADGWVFECAPLVIDGRMYVITPYQRALCLNAETGETIWEFDPEFNVRREGGLLASRGLSYWRDGNDTRIFLPVRDGRLIALHADSGKPVLSFADRGTLDLRTQLKRDRKSLSLSSPPAVYKDLLITGFQQDDGGQDIQPAAVIAIGARNGEIRWTFNTVPQAGAFGADTWQDESWRNRGGANVWSIMSVDEERGLVYLPTGAPNFDFYGGDRKGKNLFSNSLVCLDANTGERQWHFQTVHHDLWDYDLPAQPNLVDLTVAGEAVPAVAQIGKTGFLYVFNRVTGEPLWPIEEKPVPQSGVPGEEAWPTQPFPTRPEPFARQRLTIDDLSKLTEEVNEEAKAIFKQYRSEGIFTPPSLEGSIVMPGFHGGGNWSGSAFDPTTGRLYINSTELVCLAQLEETPRAKLPYKNTGWVRLRGENNLPINARPWGQLNCYGLNEGELLWQVPLGHHPEIDGPATGQENFGGPIVTNGGLVFIASTPDAYFRAFDAKTGEEIWKTKLDYAAYAIPVTYTVNGKQYIALCAGGGSKLLRANGKTAPKGDAIIAFALPDR